MTKSRLATLALAVMLGGSAALADDLSLGGNYVPVTIDENGTATTVGGGPITISHLDGTQLTYVYCVGLFTDVFVPDDYPDTIVTRNGVVDGALVNNAGEIVWLLDNFAAAAAANTIDQQALQTAIWSVEYDRQGVNSGLPLVTGDSGQSYYSQYQTDMASLGTAPLSDINWFSPGDSSSTVYQGLVGPLIPGEVPEPTSILLLGTVLLFAAKSMKRKKPGTGR
jgi:hypothetical protein